jgi:hypothetical protein
MALVVRNRMSEGKPLFICPYCPVRFFGKYDFALAEKHIKEQHPGKIAGFCAGLSLSSLRHSSDRLSHSSGRLSPLLGEARV